MGWSVSSLDHICIVYNLVAGLAPFSSYWMACATDLSGGVVLSNMRGPYPTSEGVSCQAQSRVCALSQDPLTSSPTDYAVWVASGGPSVLVVPGLAVATPHEWLWARLQLPPRLIGAEVHLPCSQLVPFSSHFNPRSARWPWRHAVVVGGHPAAFVMTTKLRAVCLCSENSHLGTVKCLLCVSACVVICSEQSILF
ncbi:uncharacterized protein LOC124665818 isoform X1 [Lolium rigidum]|uniref:uncharacterized protein LOC124665818 isoform X1 n=1 Tax=Lolium rigidum TaxID=89674 RepID=UPI001F5DE52C|nr:uncharacterized protein LOC124665818 isoform X1 [Lolium rigidum]